MLISKLFRNCCPYILRQHSLKLKNRVLIFLPKDEVQILRCDLYEIIFCVSCTPLPMTHNNLDNICFWHQIWMLMKKNHIHHLFRNLSFLLDDQKYRLSTFWISRHPKIQIKAWIVAKVYSPIGASYKERICNSPTD